jgi:hypothetical protein
VIGHDAIALGDLRAVRQPRTREVYEVPVRRVDDLQAFRNEEGNRPVIGGTTCDHRAAVVTLAGSLTD